MNEVTNGCVSFLIGYLEGEGSTITITKGCNWIVTSSFDLAL
jgi:hypothetical protein